MQYNSVMMIDDDDDDQFIFSIAMEEVNNTITLTCRNNASNALHELTTSDSLPDLIFLDLNMPGMNGEQFLSSIKENEHLQKIPVIVFSTSSQQETIDTVKNLGAADFICKPSDINGLVALLQPIFS